MTVCIAVKSVIDQAVVTVTDQMISYSNAIQAADSAALKIHKLGRRWVSLFAGSPLPVLPVLSDAGRRLARNHRGEAAPHVARLIANAWRRERDRQLQERILSPYGLTMTRFIRDGRRRLGESEFSRISREVQKFNLEVEFLLAGADDRRFVHIAVVRQGAADDRDIVGYAAIGSGTSMALASIVSHVPPPTSLPIAEAVARACEAKFCAETASGVGKETTVLIIDRHGTHVILGRPEVVGIRAVWERARRRRPSGEYLRAIERTLAQQGFRR